MDWKCRIYIRSRKYVHLISVDFEDSGPGIPEDVKQNLFSPFVTPKRMGKGTGLGLNISFNIIQKHNGQIQVTSRPGKTKFSVQIPINLEEERNESVPLQGTERKSDDDLLNILRSSKTIAVVGISDRKNSPAYTVSKYLQENNYDIFPINPQIDQVLGEKAHPDLSSLKINPDLVLIFRRSEFVPDIVNQAIEAKAKVVWMQEGIINNKPAETAKAAGLEVVIDTCMRKTHLRLLGGI